MNSKIELNSHARESAGIYVDAVIEACEKVRIKNPKATLSDTDQYPKLMKIPDVEYAIGWLNGCAEAHGVIVDVLWDQIIEDAAFRKTLETADKVATARGAAK